MEGGLIKRPRLSLISQITLPLRARQRELIQTFPESKYIPMANLLIEKVDKIETSLKMAEQAEQKQDYKNAMMYYKEILAIAPKKLKDA